MGARASTLILFSSRLALTLTLSLWGEEVNGRINNSNQDVRSRENIIILILFAFREILTTASVEAKNPPDAPETFRSVLKSNKN